MITKSFFLLISIFFLISCQPKVKKESIHIINNQLNTIDSILQRYRKLPVDSLQLVLATKLYPQVRTIRENISVFEKLSDSDKQIFYAYVEYVKTVEELIKLANKTLDGVGMARVQLMALKNDIGKNHIPVDSIMQYVEFEVENFSIIQIDVQKVLEMENLAKNSRKIEMQLDSIVRTLITKPSKGT